MTVVHRRMASKPPSSLTTAAATLTECRGVATDDLQRVRLVQ